MSDNKVVIKEQNFLDSEGDDCFYPDFSLDAADDEVFNVENDVDDSYTLSLPLKVEAETDPPSALIEIGKLKQCPKCFKTYTFATSCKRHIAKCDGVYRGRRSQPTTKSKSEEILRNDELLEKVCPLCLMEHKRYATLLSHLNQHKARIDVAAIVNCPLCQTAVSKLELNRHFSSAHPNEGSGICCECFKIGSEKVSLKRHFARNHKYESKNVLCPECGCGFTFHHELSVHYAEKHDKGGVNTAVCHQCGKTFHHRKRLVSHLRAAHRKSVKFECHVCVKVFYQQCHLVKHLQVHTGVKPWKCAHCVYKSVRKDNVLLHCRKVHQLLDANGERDVVKANDSEPTTVT